MLELNHVSVAFKGDLALEDITLSMAEGDSVAVVGESGAGKSTLGRVLVAMQAPSSGQYMFDGETVSEFGPRELRRWRQNCQVVFQNPASSLDPRLRIEELLLEPLRARRRVRRNERISVGASLLEAVGLDRDLGRRFPGQLSGGQLQRVAIARALSVEPRLIVLDEPVSGLDVSVRAKVLELLRDVRNRRGLSFVYITHDLATVASFCEYVYVMYRGRIVEGLGATHLADGTHPYTRSLFDSVLDIESSL